MSAHPSTSQGDARSSDDSPREIINALTVDVEDYFQVEAFRSVIGQENWGRYDLRVESSTMRVLDLFDRHDVKGTFFTLGWIAHRCPRLVKEIVHRGHEFFFNF